MNLVPLSEVIASPRPILTESSEGDPGAELRRRVEALIRSFDYDEAKKLGDWLDKTFTVNASRTPRGQKSLKQDAAFLHRFLANAHAPVGGDTPEIRKSRSEELANRWSRVEDHVDALVQHFSRAGKKGKGSVPAEMKAGQNVYINEVGFTEGKLKKWVRFFEDLWGGLKGWRKKALKGGITVVLARPKEFSGTVSGKYRRQNDQLLVRATPKVMKRTGGSYAAPDYVLVHELAHRYEAKNRVPYDFDRPEWHTTKYSRKDGESFAELFAMGHFKPSNASMAVDKKIADLRIAKFEQLMQGRKVSEGAVPLRQVVQSIFDEDIGHLHLVSKRKKLAKAKVGKGDPKTPIPRGAERSGGGNRRMKSIPI